MLSAMLHFVHRYLADSLDRQQTPIIRLEKHKEVASTVCYGHVDVAKAVRDEWGRVIIW